MKHILQASLNIEVFSLLVQGALRSIPFNAALAVLLALDCLYNNLSANVVISWLLIIVALSIIRWVGCALLIRKEYFRLHYRLSFSLFYILNILMGGAWSVSYFIFTPYFNQVNEALFIVVLGGLAAGSLVTMSMCLPAYYAYIVPMFFPIIIYNFYLVNFDKFILGAMYSLFVLMIFLTAQVNSRLLMLTNKLNKEKDSLIEQLTQTNSKLELSIQEVREMSITDSLTNLFNRRYFDMIFSKELSRAKRGHYPINLVFMDIDNFKYINDSFGHPAGDQFLIYVAEVLRSMIRRASDVVFRLGGDEFAAILPMPVEEVNEFCMKIKDAFNQNNGYKNVTLSMGIISMPPTHISEYQSIITAADNALYQAKRAGKNKIIARSLG
jgi:diguanylate cyclase (GGDEF)-like protein